MTTFDILFYNIFSYYKSKYKQKANRIAVFYVTLLQSTLLLLLGVFFAEFFNQMNMETMSSSNAWTLYVLIVVFIQFKNWLQYTGKRRMMINAKMLRKKADTHNIYLLWSIPFVLIALTLIIYQAIYL